MIRSNGAAAIAAVDDDDDDNADDDDADDGANNDGTDANDAADDDDADGPWVINSNIMSTLDGVIDAWTFGPALTKFWWFLLATSSGHILPTHSIKMLQTSNEFVPIFVCM